MKRLRAVRAGTPARRKEIIQAALQCFSELGYTDTSMSDICARSKASTGSVYHHFKSKEQLAAAVYMDGIREYQAGLIASLEKAKDACQGITSMVRYHITWVADNPEWSRFLFQKRHEPFLEGTDEEFDTLNKHFAVKIAEFFARHMEAGAIRRLPWDVLIAMVLGPCQEYARIYLSGRSVTQTDSAIRKLSAAVWQALSGSQAAPATTL